MTTLITIHVKPAPCTFCFEACPEPRITLWNVETNKKIRICSDKCLMHYQKWKDVLFEKAREQYKFRKNTI
jgi:hypothetical protein